MSNIWTREVIHARCDELGQCLIWRGAATESGCPKVEIAGKSWNLRNYLFTHLLGRTPQQGRLWQPNCGNLRCLSEACMTQVTRSAIQLRIAKREEGNLVSLMNRQRRAVAAGFSRLGREKAAEIRASDEPCAVLSARYGVHDRTIHRIRKGEIWKTAMPANSVFGFGGLT